MKSFLAAVGQAIFTFFLYAVAVITMGAALFPGAFLCRWVRCTSSAAFGHLARV